MSEPAQFIPSTNGELYDFEIVYGDPRVPFSSVATATHVVREAKTIKRALLRFDRAVPDHGPIKSIRKVEP